MTDRDMAKAPPSGGAFTVEKIKNNGFISGKTIGGRNFNVAERRADMQSEHVKIVIDLYIRILYNKYGEREHVQCPRAEYEREGNIMAKLSKIPVCMLCALMSAATVKNPDSRNMYIVLIRRRRSSRRPILNRASTRLADRVALKRAEAAADRSRILRTASR